MAHNKLWKILQEMGIPDNLTCLLRNLYAQSEVSQKDKDQYSILTHMEFRKMVMITLYVKQKKRHRCTEQTFGLWEKVRVGCSERTASKHGHYLE